MKKYFKCFIAALFLSAVMFSVSFSADKKEKKEEFKIDKAFLDLFKMSGNEKIAVIPPVNKDNYVMDFFKKEGLMDKVKILSPKELVNRKIFNYRKYKIAFYLGYENYVQSVNSPGDGDRAITEYVESGGTLFVFANGPSPFYYNEKGTVVDYAVTLNLGIIKGKQDQYMTAYGFEHGKVPKGSNLKFKPQRDFKVTGVKLNSKMEFPSTDADQRWRPIANKERSKAYIPLISLYDNRNNWMGDGAAYNSGYLYAWFNLTQLEVMDRHNVIKGLIKFVLKSPNLPREKRKVSKKFEKISKISKKYEGIKIAVLPGPSGTSIEAWLSKSGISYDKLSWQDVSSPRRFNVSKYPIAVYLGGEMYQQTVQVYADVDENVTEYLSNGGLLVVSSVDPWPLYMNEEKEVTYSSGKFGIPICGMDMEGNQIPDKNLKGFEKPSPDVKYNFVVNKKALRSLPEKITFPREGDTRWRPIVGDVLAKDDIYLPLVRLMDNNEMLYGDGVAYVEHIKSEPVNGKNLYIWFRMPELFGYDSFYYDIFEFIISKKK